jgi:hypothetical protein
MTLTARGKMKIHKEKGKPRDSVARGESYRKEKQKRIRKIHLV